jgi:hypothetical protein
MMKGSPRLLLWIGGIGIFTGMPALAGGTAGGGGVEDGSGPGTLGGGDSGPGCLSVVPIVPENPDDIENDPVQMETFFFDDGTTIAVESRTLMVSWYKGTTRTTMLETLSRYGLQECFYYVPLLVSHVGWTDARSVREVMDQMRTEAAIEDLTPNAEGEGGWQPDEVFTGNYDDEKYYPQDPNNVDNDAQKGKAIQWWVAKGTQFHLAWNLLDAHNEPNVPV